MMCMFYVLSLSGGCAFGKVQSSTLATEEEDDLVVDQGKEAVAMGDGLAL